MDPTQILIGLGIGAVLGGVIGFVFANMAARARTAGVDAMRIELDTKRNDCESLLRENQSARVEAGASKALLGVAQQSVLDLQRDLSSEREKVADAKDAVGKAQAQTEGLTALYNEKVASLEEVRKTVEQSRTALTDVFKATGVDLLKATTDTFMAQAREQFENQSKLSQQDLESRQKAFDATLTPFKEQLVKQETLMKSLDEKRAIDATTLTEQFKQIAMLQKEASGAAQLLTSAMRDNRQRGKWGETQLRNIVEMAGMVPHIDYNEQETTEGEDGRIRPDMTINLPSNRVIPIDVKVPMDAYLDSLKPELSESERMARRNAHPIAVRTHVRALTSREYAKTIGADIEMTIMFVPVESALSVALEIDGSLFEDALKVGIIITTPSTLLALLRICALQWKQAAVTENAQKIGESAKELLDRIITFADHLQTVGKGIESATKAYNKAVGSFNTRLLTSARATAEFAADLERLPAELDQADSVIRTDISGVRLLRDE
jgi:DNA recombination protein RmuC